MAAGPAWASRAAPTLLVADHHSEDMQGGAEVAHDLAEERVQSLLVDRPRVGLLRSTGWTVCGVLVAVMTAASFPAEPTHIGKIADTSAVFRVCRAERLRHRPDQVELPGTMHGRGPRRHIQLRVHRPQMGLHGTSTELEPLGHLRIV